MSMSLVDIEKLKIKKIQRNRAEAVNWIYKETLKLVYEEREHRKSEAMAEIAQQNQVKIHGSSPTFIYKGKWYTYPSNAQMPKDTKGFNRFLDHEFLQKVYAIMEDESFEAIEMAVGIKEYLGNMITTCNTIEDLKTLLPNCINLQVYEGVAQCYNIGDPLTDEQIEIFNLRNQNHKQALQQFLMMELLMAKVG